MLIFTDGDCQQGVVNSVHCTEVFEYIVVITTGLDVREDQLYVERAHYTTGAKLYWLHRGPAVTGTDRSALRRGLGEYTRHETARA